MTELSDKASQALRTALNAEHAAVWTYELATAFAGGSKPVADAISEATEVHEGHRDAAQRAIRAAGGSPPVAAPAYALPQQPTDQASAVRVLITAEHECQVAWRAVLESTEPGEGGPEVRRTALDALTTAASRETRWRITIDQQPSAITTPGKP